MLWTFYYHWDEVSRKKNFAEQSILILEMYGRVFCTYFPKTVQRYVYSYIFLCSETIDKIQYIHLADKWTFSTVEAWTNKLILIAVNCICNLVLMLSISLQGHRCDHGCHAGALC